MKNKRLEIKYRAGTHACDPNTGLRQKEPEFGASIATCKTPSEGYGKQT